MKTKLIFLLAAVFAGAFFFACNKEDIQDPPVPAPDYRDNFEGTYLCRQVDMLKQELTDITVDTTFDDTLMVDVLVDHDLPGYIRVHETNEREIPIDSTGIFTDYKYSLKFINDSLYINKEFGGNGYYTETNIFGKRQ
jgi:hypothetical protein